MHSKTVIDQAREFEGIVAASPAGLVQFVPMELGAALQHVGLVAVLELLLLWSAQVVPSPVSSSRTALTRSTTADVCPCQSLER